MPPETVGVYVDVGVRVAVGVAVLVGVAVGEELVAVLLGVRVGVLVAVAVRVGVLLELTLVAVPVGVLVGDAVLIGVLLPGGAGVTVAGTEITIVGMTVGPGTGGGRPGVSLVSISGEGGLFALD